MAAAYAFDLVWGLEQAGLSPFELRSLVREVWAKFEKKARSTAEIGAGLGWDLSAASTHACDVSLSQGNVAEVEAIARLAGRMYAALSGAKSPAWPEYPARSTPSSKGATSVGSCRRSWFC